LAVFSLGEVGAVERLYPEKNKSALQGFPVASECMVFVIRIDFWTAIL